MKEPSSIDILANGLPHHVLEWPPARGKRRDTALLLHGYMDAAATWDRVAPQLAAADLRVLGARFAGLRRRAARRRRAAITTSPTTCSTSPTSSSTGPAGAPLFLVGHSMGGTIATLYAGALPERVTRLALLEGAGPPDNRPTSPPTHAPLDRRAARVRGRGAAPDRLRATTRCAGSSGTTRASPCECSRTRLRRARARAARGRLGVEGRPPSHHAVAAAVLRGELRAFAGG